MGNDPKVNFKILFITQDDPFYVKIFFEEFFKEYDSLKEISGVIIASSMGKKNVFQLGRQMLEFYGPADFFKMGRKYLRVRLSALSNGVLNREGHSNLAQLCKFYGIKYFLTNAINSESVLKQLQEMDLDLIISVAAPVLFKQDLISLPRYGCINIHNAKLPKYRGMMPNFWQMYHGEKTTGITIHEINPKIDDGRILFQEEMEIAEGETLDSLIRKTKKAGAHMMIEAIRQIKRGAVQYLENPAAEGSYYSFPKREDVKEFKKRGYRIF